MTRPDWRALVGGALAAAMLCVYVAVMHRQGDRPLLWFVAGLALGVVLAWYGAFRAAPARRETLLAAAVVLGFLGVLGLLTIGFPIVVGAVLCLVAALAVRETQP